MGYSLREFHPWTIFIYYCSIICMTVFCRHPLMVLGSLLLAVMQSTVYVGRVALKTCIRFGIPVVLLSIFANALLVHEGNTALYTFSNGISITLESVMFGMIAGVMIVAVVLWCICLSSCMHSEQWLHLFGSTLPTLGLIFSMVLRFIPLYKRKWREIMDANLIHENNVTARLQCSARCFMITFVWALEHGVDTANSMTARGYGIGPRSHYKRFIMCLRDYVLCAIVMATVCLYVIGMYCGWISFEVYPELQITQNACTWLVWVGFIISGLVPTGFVLFEKYREKAYYVSN